MKLSVISVICIFAMFSGQSVRAEECSADYIATAMAPNQSLRGMLLRVLPTTVTVQMVMQQNPEAAMDALKAGIEDAVATHGGEWKDNLAASYEAALSEEQFAEACVAVSNKDMRSMLPFQQLAGAEMQRRSSDLLIRAGTTAIQPVVAMIEAE